MELHDFRTYQPGDDLRQLDWNAVARTGELVLRVRRDEVSPRVEVLVDGSRSMAVSAAKSARSREVAAWVALLADRAGFEVAVTVLDASPRRLAAPEVMAGLDRPPVPSRDSLDGALARAPAMARCGVRVVVSDFLFEVTPRPLVERLARGVSWLVLVQVLDPEDVDPSGGAGVRLVDAETEESLERFLTPGALEQYRTRFAAHVAMWEAAARRVHARWLQVSAEQPVEALARRELAGLVAGAP